MEVQAIGRVYRIGQEKKTYSLRFLADDTVDTRMYNLQQKKLKETNNALDEFSVDIKLTCKTMEKLLGWRDNEDGSEEDVDQEEDEYDSEMEGDADDDDGDPKDEDYED